MGAGTSTAPLVVTLLTAVTTGTSVPVWALPFENLTLYLVGAGTISAGTLIVEEATFAEGHSTTALWSAVTGGNPLDCTQVSGGAQQAYQLPIGAYHYIRVRVGTTVSGAGGAITAVLCGN